MNVTFPEEYQAENLAGKDAVFKVKIHEIKTKEVPALDDEFAKDVSEFDTLDELKADLKKQRKRRRTPVAIWRTSCWSRPSTVWKPRSRK